MKRFTCCLLCVLLFVFAVSAVANEIKIKTSGGTQNIPSAGDGEKLYYSLSALRSLIGGTISWDRPGYSVTLTMDNNRFLFAVGSPYVNLNDSIHNIMLPIKIVRGELYVPASTFTSILNLATPENITWNADRKMLNIDSDWFNITDVAIASKENGVLIEIFMPSPLQCEIYESEGNWINIDFPEGRINRNKVLSSINTRHVRKINAFQFDQSAQVSFRLRRPYKSFRHSYKTNPGRLQIAIEDTRFNPDSAMSDLTRIGPDEKIDVIVIDPGHGGSDYGAIGRHKKTREKDINLEIAKGLAKLIRKDKQFKVVMTRSKDKHVSLDDRAKIANDAKADLFISIHCNASPKTSANGFQVFYLAPAKSDAARAVAQFENAPFLLDDPVVDTKEEGDLAFILNDMIQTEFLTESADLANLTDLQMRKKVKGVRSRGIDHAGFFVLNRVYMPSILVEAAFISNKAEEKKLRDKKYRKQIVESIYEAVKRFKAKYERI